MGELRGRVRVEGTGKRVRVLFGGEYVADSSAVSMVWERPYYPTYYFPIADVRSDLLVPTGELHRSPSRGVAEVCTVKTARAAAQGAARTWGESEVDGIRDHVSFEWSAMDHWFEEDEEVFVHARDPYTRVDILQSSRRVEIVVGGVKVADSSQPRLLFETGLPTRYYLPKTGIAMELLTPTDLHTSCPYKGRASYWSVVAGEERFENIAWEYPTPLLESIRIAGYLSFFNEKVDIYVDGRLQERPKTPFS